MSDVSLVSDGQLADFADAILELSRKLDLRAPELHGLVLLTGTEIAVIREIHRSPRITPTQLAAATGIKRSNISTAIRTLEARGLVVRQRPDGDGRSVELVPTELAAQSVARIREFWSARLRQAPQDLLAEGIAVLDLLTKLADSIVE